MSIIGNVITMGGGGSPTPTPTVDLTYSLKFYSLDNKEFTLRTYSSGKIWSGQQVANSKMEWTNGVNDWQIWDGTTINSSNGLIALRGTGNKRVCYYASAVDTYGFVFGGASNAVAAVGNIDTLLDYQKVKNKIEPERWGGVFTGLFHDCTVLFYPPSFTMTQANSSDFEQMFKGCINLILSPNLATITSFGERSCQSMFENCYSLKKSPIFNNSITVAVQSFYEMFKNCYSLQVLAIPQATELANYCYAHMFENCKSLGTLGSALPATTLAPYCYDSMFKGSGITYIVNNILPATTLENGCYEYMFAECTQLRNCPQLPAMTLTDSCYDGMFSGCTSLTSTPFLPATTLAKYCYASMFYDCSNLNTISILPATYLPSGCYSYMFYGASTVNISPQSSSTNPNRYRVPYSGTGTAETNATQGMFYSGNFPLNTNYYTNATVITS